MTMLEIRFPVIGKSIESEHGYWLYSAISKLLKVVHERNDFSILGISGVPDSFRILHLNDLSKLKMRVPNDLYPELLQLAGKTLLIKENKIKIGIPETRLLKPHKNLYSRLVTIKNAMDSLTFQEVAKREIKRTLDIDCNPILFQNKKLGEGNDFIRKTIKIHGKIIVGFPILLTNLSPEDSIKLQENGLGGRRKMGCGSFVGVKA